MSFREKIAWWACDVLIAYGVYFLIVGPARVRRGAEAGFIWSFGLIAALHAVAMIVGAHRHRGERRTKEAQAGPTSATGQDRAGAALTVRLLCADRRH